MIKKLAKKVGARRAVNMLTQTALGRAILRKGMSEASKKLDIPVTAEPLVDDKSVWMLQVGKPEAKLHVQCSIHVETLAELAEVACNAWLEDSSVNSDAIMAILQSATNIKEQSDTDT